MWLICYNNFVLLLSLLYIFIIIINIYIKEIYKINRVDGLTTIIRVDKETKIVNLA